MYKAKDVSLDQAKAALKIESAALSQMADSLEPKSFVQAVRILAKAPRIGASGCGHSGIACMHFVHLLCCIERPARFLFPSEALHGGSGFLQAGDAMVLASRGGETAELIPFIKICEQKKVFIISITENLKSPLALGSGIVLGIAVSRETDRDNQQGTTSFIVMCGIFDALQTVLIEETKYSKERFALIHPGGAVGKRLNQNASKTRKAK